MSQPLDTDTRNTGRDDAVWVQLGLVEILAVVIGLACTVSLPLLLESWRSARGTSGEAGGSLLSRHLWLDEIYTHTLVTDPDLTHAGRALAAGVETHPPTYYLLLRMFTWLAGSSDVALRSFSLLATVAALGGMYALLRQTFSRAVCMVSVLLISWHPLVSTYAYEARSYALWLAASTWYACLLLRARYVPWPVWQRLGLALAAACACTVHYFGILGWTLVTVGELLARRRPGVWRGLVPAACGPLALASCVPLLVGQTAATSVSTWLDPASAEAIGSFLGEVFEYKHLMLLVLAVWLSHLLGCATMATNGQASAGESLRRQAGVSALLLLPVALVGFSLLVQPVLVPRYALPAVTALVPALAFLLARLARGAWLAVAMGYLLIAAAQAGELTRQAHHIDRRTDVDIAAIRAGTGNEIVIFESPARLYVVCRYAPDLARRCFLLDFEEGEIAFTPRSRIFVRDLARRYAQYYPTPRLIRWADAKRLRHFYVAATFFTGGDEKAFGDGPYPGFSIRRLGDGLYEFVRQPAIGGNDARNRTPNVR